MKKLFSILCTFVVCLFLGGALVAQNIPQNPNKTDKNGLRQGKWTIHFDKDWKPIADASQAQYYRLIEYQDDKPVGKARDYYLNGTVQWEGTLVKDRPEDVMHGEVVWYRKDGTKEIERGFDKGKQISEKIFYTDGIEITETWEKLHNEGETLYNQGKYKESTLLLEKAIIKAEKKYGKGSQQYNTTILILAPLYFLQEKYDKSEMLYKETENIPELLLFYGKESVWYAKLLDDLGDVYYYQAKYQEA